MMSKYTKNTKPVYCFNKKTNHSFTGVAPFVSCDNALPY